VYSHTVIIPFILSFVRDICIQFIIISLLAFLLFHLPARTALRVKQYSLMNILIPHSITSFTFEWNIWKK